MFYKLVEENQLFIGLPYGSSQPGHEYISSGSYCFPNNMPQLSVPLNKDEGAEEQADVKRL